MGDIPAALTQAVSLIWALDADLIEIVLLSFEVSFLAVGCAVVIGMPLGAALAVFRFPGQRSATIARSRVFFPVLAALRPCTIDWYSSSVAAAPGRRRRCARWRRTPARRC